MVANPLAQWNKAKAEIERATSIDEIKSIRDKAEALRLYAKQAGESHEVQNRIAEIKVRAERKGGELLAAMAENGGRQSQGGDRKSKSHDATLKLADLGISRTQSHRWQRIAAVPEDQFEDYIERHRASETAELTSKAILGLARIAAVEAAPVASPSATSGDLHELVVAGSKFGTIYADPPWSYDNRSTRSSADGEYGTQSLDWLCDPANMPVEALAADEAHLHLWTTNAFLFDAKRLIEAWGFEYKSCFVWVKPTIGIGNYWRVSHEFLLLGVRGGLTFLDRSQRSWGEFHRGRHSEKPDQVRSTIEKTSPGPRIELFARLQSPGWTCWGNEIERTLLS